MKITCKCTCGASFQIEGDQAFITSDTKVDENNHRFIQQQMTKDWLDRHAQCNVFEQELSESEHSFIH